MRLDRRALSSAALISVYAAALDDRSIAGALVEVASWISDGQTARLNPSAFFLDRRPRNHAAELAVHGACEALSRLNARAAAALGLIESARVSNTARYVITGNTYTAPTSLGSDANTLFLSDGAGGFNDAISGTQGQVM